MRAASRPLAKPVLDFIGNQAHVFKVIGEAETRVIAPADDTGSSVEGVDRVA